MTTQEILSMISDPDSNPNMEVIKRIRQNPLKGKTETDKEQMVCWTPNAQFTNYVMGGKECRPSGLVYIDLDSTGDFDYNKELSYLKNNPHVLAAWQSVRGVGLGSLHKVDWADALNFKQAFSHTVNVMKSYGSSTGYVDWNCQHISRVNFLTFSEQLYVNWDSKSVDCPKGIIYSYITPSTCIRVHDTFLPQDGAVLLKHETELDDWNEGELTRFIPEGREYTKLFAGIEPYAVGQRNTRLFKLGCWILKLNPQISRSELVTQIQQVNLNKCPTPLSVAEVGSIAGSVIKAAKNGKLFAPTRKRKTWFKRGCGLTPKQKQVISAQNMAVYKKEKTLACLREVVEGLNKISHKVTQKSVAEASGKSVATVKRYWKTLNGK